MPHENGVRYSEIRGRIQDGDIILFRGARLISRMIQAGSGSKYSHAAIALWWHRRLMLLQAELECIQAVPLSVALGQYKGIADWYRVRDEHRASTDFAPILDEAKIDLGLAYSTSEMLKSALHGLVGLDLPPDCETPHALFCSQYVARCFRVGGLPLVEGMSDIEITPGHISSSPILEHTGTILPDLTEEEARATADR